MDDKNPYDEGYRLRSHFCKRTQRGTFVAVSSENQSDRLVSSLVTASEEYEEYEENEENKNGFRCGVYRVRLCVERGHLWSKAASA